MAEALRSSRRWRSWGPALALVVVAAALLVVPMISAQSDQGRTRGLKQAEPAAPAREQVPTRRIALIIGVEDYGREPLSNPELDANAMYKALTSPKFKFESVPDPKGPLLKATRGQIRSALEQFRSAAAGAEVALFYFAGHGVQIAGQNYLLPREVDISREDDVKHNTIRLEEILEQLDRAGPKVGVVILDVCRNNPFERSGADTGGLAAITHAPQGTLIAYATSPGRFAQDGKRGDNGVYTRHLLKALEKQGLNIVEVFMATRRGVMSATMGYQLPWETTSLTGDLLVLHSAPPGGAKSDAEFRGYEYSNQRREQMAPGTEFSDCERCPRMVVMPTGEFNRGSPDGKTPPGKKVEAERQANEGPQRLVRIDRRFAVGKFEVTFREWEACLLDGGCDRWPNDQGWGRDHRPVIDVSWEEAQRYVAWLNKSLNDPRRRPGADSTTKIQYRLLSEAEWEYVARAGTTTARPWGETLGRNHANCADCGGADAGRRTSPAGSFEPQPWKVADMLGNVWEWVQDCRNDRYDRAPDDGTAWVNDGDCALRGIRGGSWVTAARGVRAAARSFYPVHRRDSNIGFRVATDLD